MAVSDQPGGDAGTVLAVTPRHMPSITVSIDKHTPQLRSLSGEQQQSRGRHCSASIGSILRVPAGLRSFRGIDAVKTQTVIANCQSVAVNDAGATLKLPLELRLHEPMGRRKECQANEAHPCQQECRGPDQPKRSARGPQLPFGMTASIKLVQLTHRPALPAFAASNHTARLPLQYDQILDCISDQSCARAKPGSTHCCDLATCVSGRFTREFWASATAMWPLKRPGSQQLV